jgi:hypothetical protein
VQAETSAGTFALQRGQGAFLKHDAAGGFDQFLGGADHQHRVVGQRPFDAP